jgi:hypothetical protein
MIHKFTDCALIRSRVVAGRVVGKGSSSLGIYTGVIDTKFSIAAPNKTTPGGLLRVSCQVRSDAVLRPVPSWRSGPCSRWPRGNTRRAL